MPGTREERVRERARVIWEFQGRPVGRELEHWLLAERLVELDEGRLGSSRKLADLATELAHEKPHDSHETV